jgi:hypothetical protein
MMKTWNTFTNDSSISHAGDKHGEYALSDYILYDMKLVHA